VGGVDVRATLQFVARGEAEAGIVYLTDAVGNSKVRVALEIDPASHKPIEYPVALLKREPAHPQAARLYDFLAGEKAAEAFGAAKFTFPTAKPEKK
jgi:molybdate transport system substrate-binding protein